jgi:hypothetical protein
VQEQTRCCCCCYSCRFRHRPCRCGCRTWLSSEENGLGAIAACERGSRDGNARADRSCHGSSVFWSIHTSIRSFINPQKPRRKPHPSFHSFHN